MFCALLCLLMHVYPQEPSVKLDIAVEPSFIALGPFHIAVGINDRAWIYEIRENGMNVYIRVMVQHK